MTPHPHASGRRVVRLAVQVVGLAAGLGSLGWCVSMALKPENRGQLERLAHAPAGLLAAMLALSLATIAINGLLFWVMLAPARRLRVVDVLAANGVCTLVAYLPLKLGAVTRVLIHNRRDRLPLATIGAWFAAMLAAMGVAFVPPILATLWLGRLGPAWIASVAGMELAGIATVVLFARMFRGTHGLDRLTRFAGAIPLLPLNRILRTRLWSDLHAGFQMLSSPGAVAGSVVLRLVDMGVHTTRFVIAAVILGIDLPLAQALPISLVYFLVGVVSPSGAAGLREGAATGLAGVMLASTGATAESARAFAAVALLVTATEAVIVLAAGALGVAWLRPDRLLRLKASPVPQTPDLPPAPSPAES